MPTSAPPLHDIVVADFSTSRAELAGRILAELGALVVKVEPPGGAEARTMPPFADATGESLYWLSVGGGKKSAIADIRTPEGREAVAGLMARADILIESFEPGEMDAVGLGYDAVSRTNPGIIYVSVSPFGQSGPDAHTPATDLTLQAAGGLLGLQGDIDRPPVPIGYPQAAFHAGAQAAADALVALRARGESGRGQYLDLSMQAAMVWTLMHATGFPKVTGGDPPGTGENRKTPAQPIAGFSIPPIWRCADGYITCVLLGGRTGSTPLQTVLTLAAAEGKADHDLMARDWSAWVADFAAGKIPLAEVERAFAAAGRFFEGHTQNDLLAIGVEASLLLAPAYTVKGLIEDPQLNAREYWRTLAGRVVPGIPARLSATPMLEPRLPPAPGEHQALLTSFAPKPKRTATTRPRRPFEGLKVADFAWVGVGPIVGKALADHGATVIHVESPSRPDILRTAPPFKDNVAGLDRAQFMANFNSSKIGLNLNLATEAGREVAAKLIDWADVVMESFTAGRFDAMGFSYEALRAKDPSIIRFSTCLRGQTGPQRTYGGYGSQGAAMAGIYAITGWPDRAPASPWGAYTDFIAPRYGVAALTAALLHRDRTGEGQLIDLAQVEASIHFIEPLVLDYTVNGRVAGPQGHESLYASPNGVYAAAGTERYITIACETAAQWRALTTIAPLGAFAGSEFDELAARLQADGKIDAVLADWCRDQDPFALAQRLTRAGVPASAVLRPGDLYEDAQLAHRGFFVTCDHAVMGPTPYDGPATIFSETPARLSAAPALGQHTREVLTDVLGYDAAGIDDLVARGALT
ncbi:MAG: CoA transferase [Dehalococcoidia bacterium]|nr:CoA transferase [Dehalococcoidia bacterium]